MNQRDHGVESTDVAELAVEFEAARPRLFGIAYRMLGSVVEAEDVVQDAWVKWQTTERSSIRNPAAFLTTITTRTAINVLTSARMRREAYSGPWLPEPVLTESDPALGAENSEALEFGLLLLLERLTPTERAVYLLHEAFAYSYSEVAEIIDTTEVNARQLGRRARTHLAEQRVQTVTPQQRNRLLHAFLAAANSGDLSGIHALLTEDIVVYSDGGGLISAARRPIVGRERAERFLAGILNKTDDEFDVRVAQFNGADAVVLSRSGEPYLLSTIGADEHGINRIFFVLNPQKLGSVRASA